MSRKRIVVALLLVVTTLGVGIAGYFVTRTKGTEIALSTPEAPIGISEFQPADEIGISTREELLKLAALGGSKRAATDADRAAAPMDAAAEASDEETTVAMETVGMPETSIVMGHSTADGGSEAGRASVIRLAVGMGGASARGGSGNPSSGDTPPDSPPPSSAGPSPADSQNPGDSTPPPNEALQNPDEGEGTPKDPEGEPLEPTHEENPVDPAYQYEPPPGEQPVSVPEPGTLILLGAGLAALGYGRRRLKQ
jgi:hypothetical protein